MSVTTCQHLRLVFNRKDLDKIVKKLALSQEIEPSPAIYPIDDKPAYNFDISKNIQEYTNTINFLETKTTIAPNRSLESIENKLSYILNNFDQINNQFKYLNNLITQLQSVSSELQNYLEQTKLTSQLIKITKNLNLQIFRPTQLFQVSILSIPQDQLKIFQSHTSKNTKLLTYLLGNLHDQSLYLAITFNNKDLTKLSQTVQYDTINIPHSLQKTEIIQSEFNIESATAQFNQLIQNLTIQINNFYEENQTTLKLAIQILHYEQQLNHLKQNISYFTGLHHSNLIRNSTLLKLGDKYQLDFWVDPINLPNIKSLTNQFKSELIEINNQSQDPRTLIKNNFYLKPFEYITKLMGVPSTQEIDPTPFFAPFFIIFFGFALGDGGYGLIMTIASIYAIIKFNSQTQVKLASLLLLYCGLSTVFFGAITGSWFGVNPSTINNSFGQFLANLKLIDMQNSVILLLGISILAGFFNQIIGLILEAVVYIKNKQTLYALALPGTWIFFLTSGILKLAIPYITTDPNIANYINTTFIISLLMFIFGQGIKSKNKLLIPLIGIAQLFNITGFLSNSLSYARLLALGLATGVIAGVINFLASLFGNTDTFLGIIIYILILLLGHTINIGLNLLGTFINVLRLQLVEFFPRFFNASGYELTPFKLSHLYFQLSPTMQSHYENDPVNFTSQAK